MKSRQTGSGLVELMISLVLGLLISALAMQMFMTSRASVSTQEALSFLQESARYASYRLQPMMRNIGYAGCASNNLYIDPDLKNPPYSIEFPMGGKERTHRGLSYWEMTFVFADKEAGRAPLESISDEDNSLSLKSGYEKIFLNEAGNLVEKVASLSDCLNSEVFIIDKIVGGSIYPDSSLSRLYNSGSSPVSYVYPVKVWTLRLNDQGGNEEIRSLYLDRVGADFAAEEIVSGVTGFVITFSLDTDGDGKVDTPNKAANSMTGDDWQKVRRIELALTLQSQPGAVSGGPNQGRLERTFNLTFTPRNLQLAGEG
ncbi:PilW family protein [Halomonas sp. M20]|uniref:PilW family protein n=1 Tax=Halomonas sp. M20 TaxID=2763264 RepID=UPI001D0AE197|nr:PilW family protein [Halomonas sp. M20]